MDDRIDISVLLPVKNGGAFLEDTLRSIRSQKSRLRYEVLAIDSGSIDRSVDILKAFDVPVVPIDPGTFNHGLTRNCLAGMAKGRFLLFLNQDVRLCPPDAFDRLAGHLGSDQVAAVFARQKAGEACGNILWRKEMHDNFPAEPREITGPIRNLEDWKKKFPLFSTACGMIRADRLKDHPFREMISGEDQEWAARMLNSGLKIVYEPGVDVIHSHDGSLRGIYAYYYGVGRASVMIGLEKSNPVGAVFRSWADHYRFIMTRTVSAGKKVSFHFSLPLQVIAAEYGRHRGMKT